MKVNNGGESLSVEILEKIYLPGNPSKLRSPTLATAYPNEAKAKLFPIKTCFSASTLCLRNI